MNEYLENGHLYMMGNNSHGQLAQGDTQQRLAPTLVNFFKENRFQVMHVGLGENHVIAMVRKVKAMKVDPDIISVYTWGAGIVNGFRETLAVPSNVEKLGKSLFVTAGKVHCISIDDRYRAFSFGLNEYGELGNGEAHVQALVKVRLVPECNVVQAVCGKNFTVALIRGQPPAQIIAAKKGEILPSAIDKSNEPKKNIDHMLYRPAGSLNPANAAEEISKLLAAAQIDISDNQPPRVTTGGTIPMGPVVSKPLFIPADAFSAGSNFNIIDTQPVYTPMSDEIPPPPADDSVPTSVPTSAVETSFVINPHLAAATAAANSPTGSITFNPTITASVNPTSNSVTVAVTLTGNNMTVNTPMVISSASSASLSVSTAADPFKAKKEKKKLPDGWKKVKDTATGRSYYYNRETRETTWKRPG